MQKYTERPFVSEEVRKELKNYPELLQELLIARGLLTEELAEPFLNPDYGSHIHNPFLMKNMERAVDRILLAISKKEKIAIYSDYDCDGIPGGVLMHDFFTMIGYGNFLNYIPHRHQEGYGLNVKAIEKLKKEDGTQLLITVDSGITDVEQVKRANKLGVDVIITDHHLPLEESGEDFLPSAYAVLNPKQQGDTYPEPMLCGTGVAFKLVQGILKKNRFGLKEGKEKWLLDLVGLATIADMVPLCGENRVFAYFGLKVLRKSPRPGLQKLCKNARIDQRHLTEDDIGFMIAPRINAASRMDEPMEAFTLLATKDEGEADVKAKYLNKINDQRKGLVASMSREIKKRIQGRGEIPPVLVMGDLRWRPALLGLVANNLVEEYQRPVFLWGLEGDETIKGSCRSDGTIDVVKFMKEISDFFLESGGHAFAGGFSVTHEKVHMLESELNKNYRKTKQRSLVESDITIDRRLSVDDVSWDIYKTIEKMSPFGEGNKKPTFLFPQALIRDVRQFGKEKTHLELVFEGINKKEVTAIGFFTTPEQFSRKLEEGRRVDLVATIERSMFKNYPELRLRIINIF